MGKVQEYTLLHGNRAHIHGLGFFIEIFETHSNVRHGHNSNVSSHFQALYVAYDKRVKTITAATNTINVQFERFYGHGLSFDAYNEFALSLHALGRLVGWCILYTL